MMGILTCVCFVFCDSMDVAYSPTGKEFVSGSYDRTIRIFNIHSAKSREVYHTKRMQRCGAPAFPCVSSLSFFFQS